MAMRICPNRGIVVSVFGWMNWNAVAEATGSKREEEMDDGKGKVGLGLSTAGQDADEDLSDGVGADDHGCVGF